MSIQTPLVQAQDPKSFHLFLKHLLCAGHCPYPEHQEVTTMNVVMGETDSNHTDMSK